ncbi:MAG TPA: hypothetical protein VGX70_22690, partial [Gemmataceae bacterium]|nr:hypothetical protein [Gemmataceae bacterium]
MNPKHPKTKYVLAAGIGLLGAILAYWFWNSQNSALPLSFDGKSEALQQTIMVPTLDTPIPEGKSAIWCVSFQIAWNRLRSLAGGEAL